MRYLSEIFGDIPELFVHFYQIITNFLCVCQSISWIPYLLKLGQYGDISCSRWDVFHKFLGDIPWMFLHYFQINTNYLYVCQSVSWLTSLLKLDNNKDISRSKWHIFLKPFGDIPWILVHCFQINLNFLYVC